MTTVSTDRMLLVEVVAWFQERGYRQTAEYFMALCKDECTVFIKNRFWISTKAVKSHIGDRLMRELECDVCTWVAEPIVPEELQWEYMNGEYED